MLMLIRNFKCKLEKSLAIVSSVSRDFQAQILNRFWTKKTREILNNISDFIMSFIKHEGFLKYSGHFLRNHHYHCCWSIVPQNFDRRADHQTRTQLFWSELACQLEASCNLYQNGLAHHIFNIHQNVLEQQHAEWVLMI